MWRGPVVERQKQATAKERGKVFAIHGKLIAIAAAKWADPTQNAALAEAMAKARKENVPNDNIDRAIKRGSGQEKGAAQIEEVTYEWYAAGGVAVIVKALTDNRNRTAPNIRHAFAKSSANLGETGSVSNFAFRFVGEIRLQWPVTEELEELIIESGASDYSEESWEVVIITQWADFAKVRNFITQKGFEILSAEGTYLPTTTIDVTEFDKALKVHTLIESLEEDEDVESVWHNASIPQNLQQEILTHIESHRFRT